jgi:hypothetical protein
MRALLGTAPLFCEAGCATPPRCRGTSLIINTHPNRCDPTAALLASLADARPPVPAPTHHQTYTKPQTPTLIPTPQPSTLNPQPDPLTLNPQPQTRRTRSQRSICVRAPWAPSGWRLCSRRSLRSTPRCPLAPDGDMMLSYKKNYQVGQFPHKSVKFSSLINSIKNTLRNLCGS